VLRRSSSNLGAIALTLALAACGAPAVSRPVPEASAPAPAPAPARQPSAVERMALREEALAAYDAHDFKTCAARFEQLATASPWAPDRARAQRRSAACAALVGDRAGALRALSAAVASGLRERDLATDADLASLRDDAAWPGVLAGVDRNDGAWRATINAELLAIFDADQADRKNGNSATIDWSVVAPRDRERARRVLALIEAGQARTADDYFHAAMVFQHGGTVDEVERAHRYALRAVELEPAHSKARWLAAAAEDRVRMYRDQPQRWGTQFRREGDRLVVYRVDPATTDAERAEWGVPSLAATQRMVDEMNGAAAK
jgi:hypothetical protein